MKTYKTIKLPDGFSLKETTDDFVYLKYLDYVVADFNCNSVNPKEIKNEAEKLAQAFHIYEKAHGITRKK